MKVLKEVLSWAGTIAIAVVIAILINLFIFQTYSVIGSSMEPTLHQGDIAVASKVFRTLNKLPDYGDIVIIDSRIERKHSIIDDLLDTFRSNVIAIKLFKSQNHDYWVKRVIGKPGDVLEIRDGLVYRNDQLLDEPYIKERIHIYSNDRIVVPENHIYVLGDNRNHSSDSRVIGPIPMSNVVGKMKFKL